MDGNKKPLEKKPPIIANDKAKLFTKLLNIQRTVCGIMKNKQTYSYNYATGDKVLSIIRPLMNDNGLLLVQGVVSVENTIIDYKVGKDNKEKKEILSSVYQSFTWVDSETGFEYSVPFHANGMNEFEKGLGSALTYAERYFLLKFFHIPTDKDDIDNPERKDSEQELKKEPSQKTAEEKLIRKSKTIAELTTTYNSLSEEDKERYKELITNMKNYINGSAKDAK